MLRQNRYCLVGIGIMFFGVFYWAAWRVIPQWLGYEFVPRKEKLSDGTVVTLVSDHLNRDIMTELLTRIASTYAVLYNEGRVINGSL